MDRAAGYSSSAALPPLGGGRGLAPLPPLHGGGASSTQMANLNALPSLNSSNRKTLKPVILTDEDQGKADEVFKS